MPSISKILNIREQLVDTLCDLGLNHCIHGNSHNDGAIVLQFAGWSETDGAAVIDYRLELTTSMTPVLGFLMQNRNAVAQISEKVGAPVEIVIRGRDHICLRVSLVQSRLGIVAQLPAFA